VAKIEQAITAGDDVERIIHMKTLHLGPEELLVAAKVGVRPAESADEVARHINAVEARIREAVPIARVIYLEPDIYSASAASASAGDGDAAETATAH
jgi:divalent metal cation (Fe/Co/Zn/Cd) transporter